MGKNRDLIQILALVIIGMFIPFLGSIAITYGLDFTNVNNLLKIGSTFGYFLLIFGIELMEYESYIMYHVLEKLVVEQKIPALAIHDALVVRTSDVEKAKEIFTEVYQETTSFTPVLRRKF